MVVVLLWMSAGIIQSFVRTFISRAQVTLVLLGPRRLGGGQVVRKKPGPNVKSAMLGERRR